MTRAGRWSVRAAICGLIAALINGCAHKVKVVMALEEVASEGPVVLELKPQPGRIEKTIYRSYSTIRPYDEGRKLSERQERLEFVVESSYRSVNEKTGQFTQNLTTQKKQGEGDLNAMAFPELGEQIEMALNKQARVFKVSKFAENSIFYVPALSLPDKPVQPGDNWRMTAEWMSHTNGIPLRLDLTTALKRMVRCGPQTCAELELNGTIRLTAASKSRLQFQSQVKGDVYFGLSTGAVIWARVRNEESLTGDKEKIEVESCLEAQLLEPQDEQAGVFEPLRCTS